MIVSLLVIKNFFNYNDVMNKIKLLNKLKLKKYRDEFGLFVVEGDKLVDEIPKNFLEFVLTIEEIGEREFKKISSLTTPQKKIAVCKIPKSQPLTSDLVIVLDRIQDPNNVGAILRNTSAADLNDVILIEGSADPFNQKSIRASMGSIFHLNLIEMTEEEFLKTNLNFVAAHITGIDYRNFEMNKPAALILGNEGGGVSEKILNVSKKITIPIKNVESLNVNAAAAILIFKYA